MESSTFFTEKKIRLKTARSLDDWLERPSMGKLARWAKWGVNGIRLESCKQGGLRYTSREAVKRFVEATRGDE